MGKGAKKPTKVRSNAVYIQKLLKAYKARAPAAVVAELEKMLSFLLSNTVDAMRTIALVYDKKTGTARPKLAQSALQALLEGNLQEDACAAGAQALVKFCEDKKAPKKKRGGSGAVSASQAPAVEAAA